MTRRLFLLLLGFSLSLTAFQIAGGRLPFDHQTRTDYELQQSVLSGCTRAGEIPLTTPFDGRGADSGPTLFRQAGLVQLVLMVSGPAAARWNFIPFFYLGLFAQDLMLLVGTWLVSRRLFSSPAAAFLVSVAASGSAFGLDHHWLNVHAVAAAPLLVFLFHRAMDGGSRWHLFLGANLAALQTLGAPWGAGLAAPVTAFLYFAGRAFVLGEPLTPWRSAGPKLLGGLIAPPLAVLAAAGQLAGPSAARPGLGELLDYAGIAHPLRYLDLVTAMTPSLDWSLYAGALSVAGAVIALLAMPRPVLARLVVALWAGLLLLGASFFLLYSVAPSLRPEPAPAFGLPVVRLIVAFLAGAGFQRVLEHRRRKPLLLAGGALLAASLLMALGSWAAVARPDAFREGLSLLVSGDPAGSTRSAAFAPRPFPDRGGWSIPSDLLGASALASALGGVVLLLWGSTPRAAPLALTLALMLHPLDAFGWRMRMSWLETYAASPVQRELQRLEPAPFSARPLAALGDAPRYAAFHQAVPGRFNPPQIPRTEVVAGYWAADVLEAGAVPRDTIRFRNSSGPASASYTVLAFTPNTLVLQVEGVPAGTRMDVDRRGSPRWEVSVNGALRPSGSASADGVREVSLDAGRSTVEFRYRAPLRTWGYRLLGLDAFLLLGWMLRMAIALATRGAPLP